MIGVRPPCPACGVQVFLAPHAIYSVRCDRRLRMHWRCPTSVVPHSPPKRPAAESLSLIQALTEPSRCPAGGSVRLRRSRGFKLTGLPVCPVSGHCISTDLPPKLRRLVYSEGAPLGAQYTALPGPHLLLPARAPGFYVSCFTVPPISGFTGITLFGFRCCPVQPR
jgi:hypothetical protein